MSGWKTRQYEGQVTLAARPATTATGLTDGRRANAGHPGEHAAIVQEQRQVDLHRRRSGFDGAEQTHEPRHPQATTAKAARHDDDAQLRAHTTETRAT
jgi:hypothetical protein